MERVNQKAAIASLVLCLQVMARVIDDLLIVARPAH